MSKQEAPKVAQLSEVDFRKLVDDDTRGRAPESLSRQLRSPGCASRWYQTLLAMQNSVEGQLAANAAESRAAKARLLARLEEPMSTTQRREIRAEIATRKAADEQWRAGALRFKSGLKEKLIEARRVLREVDDPILTKRISQERNRALARVATLEDAIRHHRDDFPPDDQPSDADLNLWAQVGR
jgi:hypothetical protein